MNFENLYKIALLYLLKCNANLTKTEWLLIAAYAALQTLCGNNDDGCNCGCGCH